MSEIRNVDTQGVSSPIEGLAMVAVLCESARGWRVYEAACVIRRGEHWEADKLEAIAYAHQWGNTLDAGRARRYFHIPKDMRFAP